MTKNLEEIRLFWEEASNAAVDADGLRPTARDPYLQAVVETAMEKWISDDAVVFDIGAGDGYSTVRFASKARRAIGFDYIQSFVDSAKFNAEQLKANNVCFEQADVMDLSRVASEHGRADIVISIRCLINLPNWEMQERALAQIASLVRPGGLYLVSEGWEEGWEGLNRARAAAELPAMNVVAYNKLLNRGDFEACVSRHFEIVAYENLGFYIFMSRVFQAAFTQPEAPTHTHDINRIAAELYARGLGGDAFSEVDYAGVYVLRRKMEV